MNDIAKKKIEDIATLNIDYLILRKYLGILGIALPLTLFLGNNLEVEQSISHYYYTGMSVFFTGVLAIFALFLISYKGFPKKKNELFSDNFITNFAGLLAIVVIVVPTGCADCEPGVPNGHNDSIRTLRYLLWRIDSIASLWNSLADKK